MATDENTIRRYQELVREHKGLIRELCWHWAASRADRARLCADLVQDVYHDLWRSLSLLDPDANAEQQRQWVRFRCRGVFSHHDRSAHVVLVPMPEGFDLPNDDKDYRETLELLAQGLTPLEREVYDMMIEGFSRPEIAERLGIKPSSVSSIHSHIVKKMKCNKQRLNL